MDESQLCRGTSSALEYGFFKGALKQATEYRRAAGYFSGSVFRVAYDEFAGFFSRGGKFEVVCNGHLSLADATAALAGLQESWKWTQVKLEEVAKRAGRPELNLMSWAIANGALAVKVAQVVPHTNAIYHEKFGLFLEGGNPFLAFEGSANETYAAFKTNYERVCLYPNEMKNATVYQSRLASEFEKLWQNKTTGLSILPLFEAFRQKSVKIAKKGADVIESATSFEKVNDEMVVPVEIIHFPSRLVLHDYQEDAIDAWFSHGGKGILEMATGAGKTFTALSAMAKVYENCGGPLAILIVAPYIHLVEQWSEEASKFGLSPICCFGNWKNWNQALEAGVFRLNNGGRNVLSVAVTNATFCSDRFQKLIDKIGVRTVLIADEVHNLGSTKLASVLPERVTLRLGLSATPARWMDQHGTDLLENYFGKIIFRFGLKEALNHEPPVLVPYRYFPILVKLDDDEQEEYINLTAAIGRCLSDLDSVSMSEMAKSLLIKRSRLIASARQKLPALRKAIGPYSSALHTLVYCGDSTVEFGDDEDANLNSGSNVGMQRQIDAVTSILGHELGMAVSQFTADTSQSERGEILSQFSLGELQAIVAIRCLDEGVNIPKISRAFILASSTNPRQFIQRRGRILRRAAGKSIAEIFDFVVRPPTIDSTDSRAGFKAGRRLIQNEMRRVAEFASLADNGPEARLSLIPMLKEWDLLHL